MHFFSLTHDWIHDATLLITWPLKLEVISLIWTLLLLSSLFGILHQHNYCKKLVKCEKIFFTRFGLDFAENITKPSPKFKIKETFWTFLKSTNYLFTSRGRFANTGWSRLKFWCLCQVQLTSIFSAFREKTDSQGGLLPSSQSGSSNCSIEDSKKNTTHAEYYEYFLNNIMLCHLKNCKAVTKRLYL